MELAYVLVVFTSLFSFDLLQSERYLKFFFVWKIVLSSCNVAGALLTESSLHICNFIFTGSMEKIKLLTQVSQQFKFAIDYLEIMKSPQISVAK